MFSIHEICLFTTIVGGCGERVGPGGRGAEHKRKARINLQDSPQVVKTEGCGQRNTCKRWGVRRRGKIDDSIKPYSQALSRQTLGLAGGASLCGALESTTWTASVSSPGQGETAEITG